MRKVDFWSTVMNFHCFECNETSNVVIVSELKEDSRNSVDSKQIQEELILRS